MSGRGDKDVATAAEYFGLGYGVSRLQEVFAAGRAEDRALFIGYMPAGFPTWVDAVSSCRR